MGVVVEAILNDGYVYARLPSREEAKRLIEWLRSRGRLMEYKIVEDGA